MCKNFLQIAMLCIISFVAAAVRAGEAEPAKSLQPPSFFALCISTHDPRYRTPADQVKLLRELGYDGIGHVGLAGLPEVLAAVDAHGLKLFQVYLFVSIEEEPGAPSGLAKALDLLRGRDTMLALLLRGKRPITPESEDRAVAIVQAIAELADKSGLRVALYPHSGDWLERTEDAVRLAERSGRKNVGAMFNLCHFLRVEGEKNLEAVIAKTAPRLVAVTINGSDGPGSGWIQPLGRGRFDNARLMKLLFEHGFHGPVGLQCYGVQGDVRENLQGSMTAWRNIWAELGQVPPRQ
jgi:sugar phosphate isomerase/epimerase